MATNAPWTLTKLQDQIQTVLEGDATTPATTDEDWTTRTNLINLAIADWEGEIDTLWDELWVANYSVGTVVNATTSYALPSDYKLPGGYVRFVDSGGNVSKLQLLSPEEAQLYTTEERFCYVTGNPQDGYNLNLNFTPVTGDSYVGTTIKIDYYKFADSLSATSDVPEMSDPLFIINRVAAQLFAQRGDLNMYTVFETRATNSLQQMKLNNAAHTNWQREELEDTGWGFGV